VEGSRGAAAIEELRVMGAVVVWWVCVVVWGAKRTERNAAAPPRPECPHQFITAAGEEARTEGRTDEADDDGWMDDLLSILASVGRRAKSRHPQFLFPSWAASIYRFVLQQKGVSFPL
jgi:hypothetical protein